jgi:hypothetical protein
MISTLLFLGSTTSITAQAVKLEAGVPFTPEEQGVYVTEADFVRIAAALDSLDLERRKVTALRDVISAKDELIETLQLRLAFEAESCQSLLEVYKEKPKPSLMDKIGEIGLWGTLGYATCTFVENR